MSDLNKISEDITNQNEQKETSLPNDESNTISISDQNPLTLKNDLKENHINIRTMEDQSCDENDSEYEDIDEDEEDIDEINDTSILTSISNKNSLKTGNELRINTKPRRMNRKRQDDEHSEGYENIDDDGNDNQNVPKINRDIKKLDKNKDLLDDDNNTQSPAYIPRKGKFYEHDDRTLNENDRSKHQISKSENHFYRDSDAKWQHDLYFRDEQISKSRYSIPKRRHSHYQYGTNYHQERLHLNDYISRSQKGSDNYYQKQPYNNYHRNISHENDNKLQNKRINNFDFKDYNNRSLPYNRDKNINTYTKSQITSNRQRYNYDPYQIDERTFHRRRNFTNSQFQQKDNLLKFNNNNQNRNRNDQKQLTEQSKENNQFKDKYEYNNYEGKIQQQNRSLTKYDLYENKNNLPPRLQITTNNQNLTQKQPYQQNLISNLSTDISNIERSKRYSNMRNNMINPIQQHVLKSQIQRYQHQQQQRSNDIEQHEWPQAPSPPTSYLPQQITPSQIYIHQQTSRYVPIDYSKTSISQQLQENK